MEQIFKVNVNGVLWGIQAAAAKFRARKQKGKIINASSIAGHDGFALAGTYSATKFAVRGLTQATPRANWRPAASLRKRLLPRRGRPGHVAADRRGLFQNHGCAQGRNLQEICEGIALGRSPNPGRCGRVVSYLAGPDSDYMTGQAVLIDGGMVYR